MGKAASVCWPAWEANNGERYYFHALPLLTFFWLLVISHVALSGCAPVAKFAGAQIDAVKASIPGKRAPAKPVGAQKQPAQPGTPVYSANECIGAVVNGRCHGSVIDTQPMRPRCYGQMIGGQCTGPMF
jgi:hypothetical protein